MRRQLLLALEPAGTLARLGEDAEAGASARHARRRIVHELRLLHRMLSDVLPSELGTGVRR